MSQARKTIFKDPVVSDHFVRALSDAGYVGYTSAQLQQHVDRRERTEVVLHLQTLIIMVS